MESATTTAKYLAKYHMLENQTIGRVDHTLLSDDDKKGEVYY